MITDLVARYRIVDQRLDLHALPNTPDQEFEGGYRKLRIKLYSKVLEFQAKAACYLDYGTFLRFVRNVPKIDDWAVLETSIFQIELECRNYTSLKLALRQQSSLQTLTNSLDEQKNLLKELIAKQEDVENAVMMVARSISDVSVEQDHEDIRNRLGSQYWSSGQWLLQSREYTDWTQHVSSSRLLLQGPMGVGKSSLISIVIQDTLADAIDNRVAFFYCSQQHSKCDDVLRSLLAQLAIETSGELVKPLRKWFELQTGTPFKHSKKSHANVLPHTGHKVSRQECVELLIEILKPAQQTTQQTTFIIDALDECDDYHELLQSLNSMQESCSQLKILVSSRMGVNSQQLTNYTMIDHFQSSSDINDFIESEMNSSARRERSGMTPAQADILHKLLISRANGM